MSTHDLSAKLPPPHDEEPAQLRSDILDELRDHLSCAVDRERQRLGLSDKPGDAVTIWQAVLERFGDPSALARRLWFDAMKGRLMTQRVLLGAVAVLATLLVVGGWRMTTTLSAVVDQNQKATAAILERMGKEAPSAATAVSPEWISVKYRLVQGTTDGPPIVGKQVNLSQQAEGEGRGRLNQMSEITNAEGVADFGLLPYGTYGFAIESSAGLLSESITLRPGRPIDLRIVVPDEPKTAELKFEYAAPEWKTWGMTKQFDSFAPCLMVRFRPAENTPLDGRYWLSSLDHETILIRPDGVFRSNGSSAGIVGTMNVDTKTRLEAVKVPAVPLILNAYWCYSDGNPLTRRDISSGSTGGEVYRPISQHLTPEFIAECQAKAAEAAEKLPMTISLTPSTEPILIRIPPNHPGTLTGWESQGFGGGGHF